MELEALLHQIEAGWTAYFETLDNQKLAQEVEYQSMEGSWYRWTVEGALTQLHNHALYHRG